MTRRNRSIARINRKSYPRRTKGKKRKSQNRKITTKRNRYRTRKYKYKKLHSGGSGRGGMRGSMRGSMSGCCAAPDPSLSPRRPTQPAPRVTSPRVTAPRMTSPGMTSPQRVTSPQRMTSTSEPEPEPAPEVPLTPRRKFRAAAKEQARMNRKAQNLEDRQKHPGAYLSKETVPPVALPTLQTLTAGDYGFRMLPTDTQVSVEAAAAKKAVGERREALPVREAQLAVLDQVMGRPLGVAGIEELPDEALAVIRAGVQQSLLPPASVVAAANTQRKK